MAPAEMGLRGEEDKWTRWSLVWRDHKAILGLWGAQVQGLRDASSSRRRGSASTRTAEPWTRWSRCTSRTRAATIFTYTRDMLSASINPPAVYGTVNFNGGGRYVLDFTDCTVEDLAVGNPVEFSFRIKYYDSKRDITNYFWKAVPAVEEVK